MSTPRARTPSPRPRLRSIPALAARGAAAGKAALRQRVGPIVAGRQPRRTDLPPSTWGLSVGPAGHLRSGGVDLHDLAAVHGTPFHLVRADALDAAAHAALAASPDVDVFYSYKTNPVPGVLRRLHDAGIGAEVISPYELWLALALDVPADRIIYNGPAKSDDSIRTALRAGVLVVNANSQAEVDRIAALAREEGVVAPLGIRVNLPGMWGGQFGIAAAGGHAAAAVRSALAHPSVELRGLHVHRGGTIRTAEEMAAYLGDVLACCDDLFAATGWHPALLDLGGSLACPTVGAIPTRQHRLNRALGTDLLPPEPAGTMTLPASSALAAAAARAHFGAAGRPVPRLVQEPGRALTAATQLLVTSVVDLKLDGPLPHAVLDAGMNVAEPVTHEYHQLFSVSAPAAPHTTTYRLAGPICTPADVLYNAWRLPPLERGHVLAIMDTGAYFVPFSTAFSFPRPAVLLQDGDDVRTLRAAETFADLVRGDGLVVDDDVPAATAPGARR